MSLVTPTELNTYTGLTITTALAQATIDDLCAEIEGYVGFDLNETADDTITLPGSYGAAIKLPGRPVSSITTVAIDGTAVTNYKLIPGAKLVRINGNSAVSNLTPHLRSHALDGSAVWGGEDAILTITYTHGYTALTAPTWLKNLCLRALARAIAAASADGTQADAAASANSREVVQETLGQHSVTFARQAASAISTAAAYGILTPNELEVVRTRLASELRYRTTQQ